HGDVSPADGACRGRCDPDGAAVHFRRRREESAPAPDRGPSRRHLTADAGGAHVARHVFAVVAEDGCLDCRAGACRVSGRAFTARAAGRGVDPEQAVPELPRARRRRRHARTCARRRCSQAHARSADSPGHSGRRQYARVRQEPESVRGHSSRRLHGNAAMSALLELTKPRITMMVVVTTATGYLLAGPATWRLADVVAVLLATAALAAGAAVMNQWLERETDGAMRRTCRRPIPTGRVSPEGALAFGLTLTAL